MKRFDTPLRYALLASLAVSIAVLALAVALALSGCAHTASVERRADDSTTITRDRD